MNPLENGGLRLEDLDEGMKDIGRRLTDEGMENVIKLDTNQDGKLDATEINFGEDSDGDDYSINIGQCNGCQLLQCMGGYSCTHGWGR